MRPDLLEAANLPLSIMFDLNDTSYVENAAEKDIVTNLQDSMKGVRCADEVNRWFSVALEEDLFVARCVRQESARLTTPVARKDVFTHHQTDKKSGLIGVCALHITNKASLEDLKKRVD